MSVLGMIYDTESRPTDFQRLPIVARSKEKTCREHRRSLSRWSERSTAGRETIFPPRRGSRIAATGTDDGDASSFDVIVATITPVIACATIMQQKGSRSTPAPYAKRVLVSEPWFKDSSMKSLFKSAWPYGDPDSKCGSTLKGSLTFQSRTASKFQAVQFWSEFDLGFMNLKM